MIRELTTLSLILITLTSVLILVISGWRWKLGLLAVQYLGVFYLTTLSWPISLAVTKLVAGWIAGALLGLALYNLPIESNEVTNKLDVELANSNTPHPSSIHFRTRPLFYIFSSALVLLLVISIEPLLAKLIPAIPAGQILGCMILIRMGILQLGFTSKTLPTILGLLTLFGGFEILYAGLETSSLVAGLLASVTLGLATIGSYLILSPTMEHAE